MLLDRADLGAGELGVDEELEPVEPLVLFGPPPVRWQPGQGQPAEALRQAKIGGRGLVQLDQRGVRVLAQPCLEEPGEREWQRLAWLGAGKLGEVAVPIGVRAGSR